MVQAPPPDSTNWAFLCGTWDGSGDSGSIKIYVDGQLIDSTTPHSTTGGDPQNLRIGAPSSTTSLSLFHGAIDEVRIYDRVLNAGQIQQLYLSAGLAGYWSFDENYGILAHDYSGNEQHGNIYFASWLDGIAGSALEFTDSAKVGILSSFDNSITDAFTIAAWVYWYGSDLSSYIFDGRDMDKGFILQVDPEGTITFQLRYPGGSQGVTSSSMVPINAWTYVAGVFDYTSQALRVFKNGIEDTAVAVDTFYYQTAMPAAIGNNHFGGDDRPFNGIIDEVRFYRRALNADELLRYYNGFAVNQAPTAIIDYVDPNPATEGAPVFFSGHGEDVDGSVIGYEWSSNLDGLIATTSSFVTTTLSVGTHTISFRVQDNNFAWSTKDEQTLEIVNQSDLSWPMFYHDVEHTSHSPGTGTIVSPFEKWQVILKPPGYSSACVSQPVIADVDEDGQMEVIVGTNHTYPGLPNGIHCFNGSTGVEEWSKPCGYVNKIAVGNTDSDPQLEVLVAGENGVYCYDGLSTDEQWNFADTAGYDVYALPTIHDFGDDGVIEVLICYDDLFCLDGADGSTKWIFTGIHEAHGIWDVTPAVCDQHDLIYVNDERYLLCIRGENGTVKWNEENLWWFTPSLGDVDNDGAIEVILAPPDLDGNVYCYDAYTGAFEWVYPIGQRTMEECVPSIANLDEDGYLEIIIPTMNRVYCLDGLDGSEEWYYSGGEGIPASIADVDDDSQAEVVLCINPVPYSTIALDGSTGVLEWSFDDFSGSIEAPPSLGDVDGDGQLEVVVVDHEGRVSCIDAAPEPPQAFIDDINPNPAEQGEKVTFVGHFTGSVDDPPEGREWWSSITGHLSDSLVFDHSGLPIGQHIIWFVVSYADSGWADSVSEILEITPPPNIPPTAIIDSVTPNSVEEGETVYFGGHGTDSDGSIVAYEWWSSIDDVISGDSSFATSGLSPGLHSIRFRVKDDDSAWSEGDFAELEVTPEDPREPVLAALNYLWYACSSKVEVMSTDMAQVQAYVYKGLFESEVLDPMLHAIIDAPDDVANPIGVLLGVCPACIFGIAIGEITHHIVTTMSPDVKELWYNTTNNIFDDPNLNPDDGVYILQPKIRDKLMDNSNGPNVDARMLAIESQIENLKNFVSTNPVPDDFPSEVITYNVIWTAADILRNNEVGENAVVRWYSPFGHTNYPDADKTILSHKLGDWKENPNDYNDNAYAKQVKSLYDTGYETERQYLATGYSALISAGIGFAVGKIALGILLPGIGVLISEVFTGIAFYGYCQEMADVGLEGTRLKWDNELALANIDIWSSFSSDLDRLDTLVTDIQRYIEAEMSDPPPYEFPAGYITLLNLEMPDILLQPGENIDVQTGSVTISHTLGNTPCKVNLYVDITPLTGGPCISVSGPEQIIELSPGQTEVLDFQYQAPNPDAIGRTREYYLATIYLSLGTFRHYFWYPGYNSDRVFWVSPASKYGQLAPPTVTVIMEDSVLEEQTLSTQHACSDYQAAFILDHDGIDLDLHIYDQDSNHTGIDYMTGELETQIPGSQFANISSSSEAITIYGVTGQEFTVEVMGISTIGFAPFAVTVYESSERPAIVNIPAIEEHTANQPGDTAILVMAVNEAGGHHNAEGINLSASDFVGSSYTIPSSNITFDSVAAEIPAGGLINPIIIVTIPQDAPSDMYTGDITVSSTTGGSDQITMTLIVDYPPVTPSTPSGSDSGYVGANYDYFTSTTDPEGDSVYYVFDWGDGDLQDWCGPVASGEACTTSHAWTDTGSYEVRVRAEDIWGITSGWSDSLIVTIAYICGDVDRSGSVNVADATYLIDYLFFEGLPPPVMEAANVNGEGGVNVADVSYLIDYLFFSGADPDCAPIE